MFDVRDHHVQLVGHVRPDDVPLPLAGQLLAVRVALHPLSLHDFVRLERRQVEEREAVNSFRKAEWEVVQAEIRQRDQIEATSVVRYGLFEFANVLGRPVDDIVARLVVVCSQDNVIVKCFDSDGLPTTEESQWSACATGCDSYDLELFLYWKPSGKAYTGGRTKHIVVA